MLTHDLDGTGATANDAGFGFLYNPASQVTLRALTNNAYEFPLSPAVKSYVTNGRNQYTQVGGTTHGWDANGNLTSDGLTTFGYDTENRLVSASGPQDATLKYDPLGRLYEASTSSGVVRFVYDGDRLIAEYNSSGSLLRRYVHGAGVDEPLLWYEGAAVSASTRRYLHADHQGSIVAASNASGAMVFINTFDSYGIAGPSNTAVRFQYTGQAAIPELGLLYYKARFYHPALGRFMQTDPIGYEDDVNLYAYVYNDPLNQTDPTGRAPGDPFASPEAAANDVIQFINPTSIRDNVEHGGHIYEKEGAFYASTPVSQGKGAKVEHKVPTSAVGDYHTHGDYSKQGKTGQPERTSKSEDQYDSDNFSSRDKSNSRMLQKEIQQATGRSSYRSYLGTPGGKSKQYDPETRTQSDLKVPPVRTPVGEFCGQRAGPCDR